MVLARRTSDLSFGTYIPLPGIDPSALDQFFRPPAGSKLGIFIPGIGIHRVSIFAIGIMPYISAPALIQIMSMAWPTLQEIVKKEGDEGPKVRYLTVPLAALQSYGVAIGLEGAESVVTAPAGCSASRP